MGWDAPLLLPNRMFVCVYVCVCVRVCVCLHTHRKANRLSPAHSLGCALDSRGIVLIYASLHRHVHVIHTNVVVQVGTELYTCSQAQTVYACMQTDARAAL